MAGAVTRADKQGNKWVDQRPEGLDDQRAQGALGPAAGAHQLGRAQAQGPGLFHPRHETARRAGPSAAADERPRLVQPGVLHRRRSSSRRFLVCRRRRRLDGGDHDPDARAPRRRRPAHLGARRPTSQGRIYDEERAEIATTMEPYKWYPQRAGRVDLVMQRAKETGKIDDPVVRQEIAKLLIMSKAAEWTARRARAAQDQGRPQGPEGSLGKLASSNVARAGRARAHLHHRRGCAADRRGQPDGRRDRRDPGLRARRPRSPAAPTRSSATSSPSACSRCRRNRASTPPSRSRTCRATRWREVRRLSSYFMPPRRLCGVRRAGFMRRRLPFRARFGSRPHGHDPACRDPAKGHREHVFPHADHPGRNVTPCARQAQRYLHSHRKTLRCTTTLHRPMRYR